MIRIQNGSFHNASCTVYKFPLILLLLLVSSEIVSAARIPVIPVNKVKSMSHWDQWEIVEVKNRLAGRLILTETPPPAPRKAVIRPPTPSGGQG
ncbi:hypothetical protein ACLB2K_028567 [Fragaria x ananassa]